MSNEIKVTARAQLSAQAQIHQASGSQSHYGQTERAQRQQDDTR